MGLPRQGRAHADKNGNAKASKRAHHSPASRLLFNFGLVVLNAARPLRDDIVFVITRRALRGIRRRHLYPLPLSHQKSLARHHCVTEARREWVSVNSADN